MSSKSIEELDQRIDWRSDMNLRYNHGGSWRYDSGITQSKSVTRIQLKDMIEVKLNYANDIRLRVEEPYISIYAETEELLYTIATTDLVNWKDKLVEVSRPEKIEDIEHLAQGAILVRRDSGYGYKITLRDGMYDRKDITALANYLENVGDDVKVSNGVWKMLRNHRMMLHGAYFYAKDQDISTMINLIIPGMLLKIHPLAIT